MSTGNELQQAQIIKDQKESLLIPIKCEISSSYEDLFNGILEMDGLSQSSIIESLDVEKNHK